MFVRISVGFGVRNFEHLQSLHNCWMIQDSGICQMYTGIKR